MFTPATDVLVKAPSGSESGSTLGAGSEPGQRSQQFNGPARLARLGRIALTIVFGIDPYETIDTRMVTHRCD